LEDKKVNKKRAILMLSIFSLVLFLTCFQIKIFAASNYDLSDQEPITIVFAIPNGATNIETVYSEKWMELVKDRSEGLISFDYTNAGALGSYAELLEAIEFGVIDMSVNDPSYIQSYVPESLVLTLPVIFNNYQHAEAVFSGEVGDWYKNLVDEKTNIDVLNYFFCGFRYICSKEPINTLDDCQGVLIRSPQIDVYTDLLGLMGFSYVTMAWSEAYTAMSTGVIDAVEVPLQNIYEAGFYNLGKYICGSRHLLSVNSVIANDSFWESLPGVYREIILDSLNEVTALEHQAIVDKEENYIKMLEDEGCTFAEFDDAGKAQLTMTFTNYWTEKVENLGSVAQGMLQKILELK
jgi:TRAP-type transport system periplasmic protein